MDLAIVECMRSVLAGSIVPRIKTRDALEACLALAPLDDEDSVALRALVADLGEDPEAMGEIRELLDEMRTRALRRPRT